MKKIIYVLSCIFLCNHLHASEVDNTRESIEANLQNDVRNDPEIARDANRKPAEVLAFFGLRADMKVLEISPSTGYWTKFLAPTLCENGGELVVSVGVKDDLKNNLMPLDGYDCLSAINGDLSLRDLPEFTFEEGDFDLVLTFWNLHNPSIEGRQNLNKAVFDSLKSGGIYGVVDHTRRHGQPDSPTIRRRLDPVLVIDEMLAVGFEFAGFSDMHYHIEDDLTQEVGTPSVRGNTDRFTMRFRKP